MNAVPHVRARRGLGLLVAHCASLDLGAPTARERLDEAVGPELATKLLFALCVGGREQTAA
jgi:hypothetical protein